MSSLDKTSEIVLKILKEKPMARNNDFILYAYVLKEKGFNLNTPLNEFLANAEKNKAPAFASVTKCRRTLQGRYPALVDKDTLIARHDAQYEYIKYNNKVM